MRNIIIQCDLFSVRWIISQDNLRLYLPGVLCGGEAASFLMATLSIQISLSIKVTL
jgi:hypothetical protein